MSKKQCPSCGNALQEAEYRGDVFYVCTCGHGTAAKKQNVVKGMVSYIQDVGGATLTQIFVPDKQQQD